MALWDKMGVSMWVDEFKSSAKDNDSMYFGGNGIRGMNHKPLVELY